MGRTGRGYTLAARAGVPSRAAVSLVRMAQAAGDPSRTVAEVRRLLAAAARARVVPAVRVSADVWGLLPFGDVDSKGGA